MSDTRATMAGVVAALKRELGDDLVAVVIFGSRARGEANEASDWDLLVVAHNLPKRTLERHVRLKKSLPVAWRGQTSILSKTLEEFESYLPSLFLDIALDGVVLYDPDGYVSNRLSELKRMIEKRGLRRERVQNDLVWRWDRFPGFGWSLEWGMAQ
ncbi:MAG: nucleotidyltransferase domain-containing protein [Chloroflexota bacterium]|nr:nucleotidyltransferase domain-containing protein [Chloroflexota bacterium]